MAGPGGEFIYLFLLLLIFIPIFLLLLGIFYLFG